ncbi:MAG: hypothetical protein QOF09_3884 [Alphaproteobacteria bacterium]|nr:hypothetical protein [Alphaproteobacteria bacterium]
MATIDTSPFSPLAPRRCATAATFFSQCGRRASLQRSCPLLGLPDRALGGAGRFHQPTPGSSVLTADESAIALRIGASVLGRSILDIPGRLTGWPKIIRSNASSDSSWTSNVPTAPVCRCSKAVSFQPAQVFSQKICAVTLPFRAELNRKPPSKRLLGARSHRNNLPTVAIEDKQEMVFRH